MTQETSIFPRQRRPQTCQICMQIARREMDIPCFKGFHFERLRVANARSGQRNEEEAELHTDERNSTAIVEEHARNKRRRFTTREIYLPALSTVRIPSQKNERGVQLAL